MIAYIVRRMFQSIFVLIGVSMVCFVIFQYLGDPTLAIAGRGATQAVREEVRDRLGLDQPVYIQYFRFITNILHGNFGKSYLQRRSALRVVIERLPATAELSITAVMLGLFLGITIGIIAAVKPRAFSSKVLLTGSLFGVSIPTFLCGILFILIFAVSLGVLPPFGRGKTVPIVGFWKTGFLTLDGLRHLVLPALTLGLYQLALLTRLTKSEMTEALGEDYVRTARSKGLRERIVIIKHALRNALIPVVTMAGLIFAELVGFSIVTETVFQWPGMGRLLIESLFGNDQPVVVTYIMLVALAIATINLIVDLSYVVLDPRITYD
jgi:peptide/nickel transport system permease protein